MSLTNEFRELTRHERTAIRKMVIDMCANYDKEYGCLLLDGLCYMLNKCWTGNYCKYFKDAVLPLDPVLETLLLVKAVETRPCTFCGVAFTANGKQMYCGTDCASKAHRKQKRDFMRKKRGQM